MGAVEVSEVAWQAAKLATVMAIVIVFGCVIGLALLAWMFGSPGLKDEEEPERLTRDGL